jgi:transcriptional regulator with XRE-family HTH domain
MDPRASEIGARIAEQRGRLGLTQQALADAVGTTKPVIADYERGRRMPLLERLFAIAEALGVPPTTLLDGVR